MIKVILSFTLAYTLYSCSSHKVVIKSYPTGSEVFARQSGSKTKNSLGVTPLELDEASIAQLQKNKNVPTIIEIVKEGHKTEKVIIGDFGSSNVTYNFTLDKDSHAGLVNTIDKTSTDLFEAQRLIRLGNMDESIKILSGLLKKYKQSSFINELMGSAYYVKRNYKKSLDYYRTAYKYDSKNIDAYKMQKYLEEKLGVVRPLYKDAP